MFLTPGQLAGQMHAPRIHFKEHMHTEKTRLQHQIWPQKRGQFSDPQFASFPIEGWFWGPLVGLQNGPRNSAFFLLLLPYHMGLVFGQHGRSCNDSLRARTASPPKGLLALSVLAQS